MRSIRYSKRLIFIALLAGALPLRSQDFGIAQTREGLWLLEGKDTVFFYRAAPASRDGAYRRANYLHPLYGINSEVLTEDFPADHLHHRGVFWAWHQVWVGDRRIGDPWECRDFDWVVRRVVLASTDDRSALVEAEVYWESPEYLNNRGKPIPIAREIVRIRVYRVQRHFRNIDFDIRIEPLVESMRLGGSQDEKGYGGFSVRMKLPGDVVFTSGQGTVQARETALPAGPWIDIAGSLVPGKPRSGIALIGHPENPGHPQPWILRSSASMQNSAWPGWASTALPKGQALRLRYRMTVHSGTLEKEFLDAIYKDFSSTP